MLKLELIDELVDVFLNGDSEMRSVLNCRTGEVLLDAPESLTGEPEIDWDSEEAEFFEVIPNADSSEMYDVMVEFAKKQSVDIEIQLIDILNGRKPFRSFKDKVIALGIDKNWYDYEQEYAMRKMSEWLEEVLIEIPGDSSL